MFKFRNSKHKTFDILFYLLFVDSLTGKHTYMKNVRTLDFFAVIFILPNFVTKHHITVCLFFVFIQNILPQDFLFL